MSGGLFGLFRCSRGNKKDKGEKYRYTASERHIETDFTGQGQSSNRASCYDMSDETGGFIKHQNMEYKHLIDGIIKRLTYKFFETDANKRYLTHNNKQLITRLKHSKDQEDAQCAQYLFHLFHEDIPYILEALRAVTNLEGRDPNLRTSPRKAAPASFVGQSFSLDQHAISHRGHDLQYQLKEKENTIRLLQRRNAEIAKHVQPHSSISKRYKTERNALFEKVEHFENAVNDCLWRKRLVQHKVYIIDHNTRTVDFRSIITEITNIASKAASYEPYSRAQFEKIESEIETVKYQIHTARMEQRLAQEETKRVKDESNQQALIIQQLRRENEEMRLEKQRQIQKATGSNASLLVGMHQVKDDSVKEKREMSNEINRLTGTIEHLSRQLEGANCELRATKSANTTLQNEIQLMKREHEMKQQHINKDTEALGDGLRNQRNFERDSQSIGKQKITDLERRLEKSQNEHASLQIDMRQVKDRYEDEKKAMTLDINKFASAIKQMQAERVSEKKHVETLERQLEEARWNISVKTNANTALQTEKQQMKSQFETNQREMQELQRRVDGHHIVEQNSKSQDKQIIDDLEHRLQVAENSAASLQSSKHQLEVDHAKEKDHMTRHTNSLKTTIQLLKSDGDGQTSKIEELERKLKHARSDKDATAKSNTALKNEMHRMEYQFQEKERNMAQEIEELKQATNDQHGIEQERSLAKQKINELESQLAGEQNTNKALQIDLKQAESNYAREKGERASDINRLNETIKRLQAEGDHRMTEQKHIEDLEQQITSAKRDLSTASDTNATLQHKMQHMKSQFELIEQRMAKEIENLKRILEDQRRLEQDSISKTNEKIAALERQLETETQAKASIQNEMRQIERRHAKDKEEINRLNAIIKDMEAEGQQTERKHKEELQRQFESSRREISVTQNANTTLQQQIQQMKSQFKEKEKSLTQEIEQLRHTINSHDQVKQDSNSQWSQKVNGLERQLELQNSTNASLKERFRQLEDEKEGLTHEINRLNVINKDLQSEKVNRMAGEKHIKELEHRLESTKVDLNAKAHECTSLHGKETRLKGHINSLNMEIAKYRSLQDQEKKSIAKLNTELSNANAQLMECRKQNASFDSATRHHKQKGPDIAKLQDELAYYQQNYKALQQSEQEARQQIRALEKRNSELVDRLATEMNSKISANESSLENISIKARPMNVAEEYSLLMSNSWLDAKSALDETDPDEKWEAEKVKLLLVILQVSEHQAVSFYNTIMEQLVSVLKDPITHLMVSGAGKGGDSRGTTQALPQNLQTSIGDYFRKSVEAVTIDMLAKSIATKVQSQWRGIADMPSVSEMLQIEDVAFYIKDCASLAWKMAIQRPRMTFETSRIGLQWKDDGYGELMWGSNPKAPGAKILYYKSPRMLHGDKPMVKASVFVHNKMNP